ncbi:hypothetical protein BH09SUM1_BH09SUM1_19820 [soil metagenome]
MKTMSLAGAALSAALMIAATTSCSNVQRGAAAGGALGALAGGTYVNTVGTSGLSGAQGVLIGGASGAAIGGLAGDAFDQMNDDDLRRELQQLRQENEDLKAEVARLQATQGNSDEADKLRRQLAERDARIRELESRPMGTTVVAAPVPVSDSDLQRERDAAIKRAQDAERQLADLRALINEICKRSGDQAAAGSRSSATMTTTTPTYRSEVMPSENTVTTTTTN